VEEPEGLVYRRDFVSADEERDVLALLERVEYDAIEMRGQVARRTARHFGYDYDYESFRVTPGEPLPSELEWLRERSAELVEVEPPELAQALVLRYPPGATIGWHRDAPMFGAKIVGVSLASSCRMRFQRGSGDGRRVYELELEPRSVYVLAGPARSVWQHSIPPTKALRYSITFRTLRKKRPMTAGR
jgi:alkylated DNA repair protein (DNA oxidative demethylase)